MLGIAARAAAADPLVMRYDADRLTVHADGVPLDAIIDELHERTGIQVRGSLLDGRVVHKQFDALPLEQALDRLLGRQNFVLVYGPTGKPEALDLLGLALPRQPAPRTPLRVARPPAAGIPPAMSTPPRAPGVAAFLQAKRTR